MDTKRYYISQKPSNHFLSTIVEDYFYIEMPANKLSSIQEFILPFPRMPFVYFFNYPFLVTNNTLNEDVLVEMGILRISIHKISVQPQSETIRYIGAHLHPFCLAYLTEQPVKTMPWAINTEIEFPKIATRLRERMNSCSTPEQMFEEMERLFLDNLLVRDLSLITNTIKLINDNLGNIHIKDLAKQLGVSERTIRNHFGQHIGCSPKEYISLVKLKQLAYQLMHSDNTMTSIAYDNNYFDQAHFIHEVKNITGKTPKELRKELPDFRFLQF